MVALSSAGGIMTKPTAVIIGAGYGGMALANILGKSGYRVDVYEKNDAVGGRIAVVEQDGFTFDLGPSWYLMPEVFAQYYELLGYDAERELEQLTRTRSLRERIIHLLGPMLHGREPELEEVASKLQLPSWTLRRKLAEEGTQFRTLLNETRRDLAVAYIRDTELAFGEIAYLLGFASAEAFQRAFPARPKALCFTNGCFDILHRGHVTYLAQAAALAKHEGSPLVLEIHVLTALMEVQSQAASNAFAAIGTDREQLRKALAAIAAEDGRHGGLLQGGSTF